MVQTARHFASGVKDLVDHGIRRVPDLYIRQPHERPHHTNLCQGDEVALIDLSGLHGHTRPQVVDAIWNASQKHGLFQVVNHGIPLDLMNSMMQDVKDFYDLPMEDKLVYYTEEFFAPFRAGTSFRPSKEKVMEWSDYFQHPVDPQQPEYLWPKKLPKYKDHAIEYGICIKELAGQLLDAISESLGLQKNVLGNTVKYLPHQIMRSTYFPPCPNPDLALGLTGHSDPGVMTILMQGEDGGLQLLKDGCWLPVNYHKGALTIMLADQIEILSNGKIKSVEHRAIVGKKSSVFIDTFLSPPLDKFISPLSELINNENPTLYGGRLFGEYLRHITSNPLDHKTLLNANKLPMH